MTMCLICDNEDAYHRYMGEDCEQTIQRRLRELETYAAVLHAFTAPTRGPATGTRAPGYSSRSPANDDVIVALDGRSTANGSGPDDVDEPVLSIPAGVHDLAVWMREEHQLQHPRWWTITSEVAYLLGRVAYAAMHRWCTEFDKQIADLHRQARGLARDQPARPISECRVVGCGGYVYPATLRESDGTTHDGTRCARCLRVYTGLDLVRLYQAQGAG